MTAHKAAKKGIWKRRAWRAAATLTAGGAGGLALLLVVLVNALAARFPFRYDLSRARYYSLSDKTKSILAEIKQPIEVIAIVETDFELFQDIRSLLREYQAANPRLKVRFVDPARDIGEARNLARKYSLAEANSLVLELGGRFAVVEGRKMMDFNLWPLIQGLPKAKVAFRGEQMLSTAIQGLLQPRLPLVAFTSGQGEGDVEQFTSPGFSRIGMALRRDALRAVKLQSGESPPEDCAAVVVLGPTRPFSPAALAALRGYLDRGGRLLVLLEKGRGTGLESFLESWGVRVGSDRVAGPALTGRELMVQDFADHPATRELRNMACSFYSPLHVQPLADSGPADRLRVTPLAFGPKDGWVEINARQDPSRFDPGEDKPGPAPVAVAVEPGVPPGLKVSLPAFRLVVVGDADFVANGTISGGNEDFFMGALNWLLEREHLAAVSPRVPDEIRMDLNGRQRSRLFMAVVAGLPGAALVLAFLVALARRR